jgi:hypothetical protein
MEETRKAHKIFIGNRKEIYPLGSLEIEEKLI